MKRSLLSINWWINKMWSIQNNGTLFGHKKEWGMDASYNMSEPSKHYCKWKKPDTKAMIVFYSIYLKCPKIGTSIGTESRLVVAQGRGERKIGSNCYWVWVFFRRQSKCSKIHSADGYTTLWILKATEWHFKWLSCMVCELYLN